MRYHIKSGHWALIVASLVITLGSAGVELAYEGWSIYTNGSIRVTLGLWTISFTGIQYINPETLAFECAVSQNGDYWALLR